MTRHILSLDSLPTDVREAVLAADGRPVHISLPHSCRWCRALFVKGMVTATQSGFCRQACLLSWSAAEAAKREAKSARESLQ